MGIGRRVRDPLRVISITCERSLADDIPVLDLEEYGQTREPSLVRPRDGEELAWFTLAPLLSERAAAIRGVPSPLRERLAFSESCTNCSDTSLLPLDSWEEIRSGRRLREAALADLPDQLWIELGSVALRLGELTVGESPRFAAPAGSRATRTRRSATPAQSATARPAEKDDG